MQQITDTEIDRYYDQWNPFEEDELSCPECGSTDVDIVIDEPDGGGYMQCEECGWRDID